MDEIIDTVADSIEPGEAGSGVLRSTRIDKKVTDLLDLKALTDACAHEFLPELSQSLDALRAGVVHDWTKSEVLEEIR